MSIASLVSKDVKFKFLGDDIRYMSRIDFDIWVSIAGNSKVSRLYDAAEKADQQIMDRLTRLAGVPPAAKEAAERLGIHDLL